MNELVIRIAFRNRTRREMRGTEAHVRAMFKKDREEPERLIDYIEALDVAKGQFYVYTHVDDNRHDHAGTPSDA